MKPCSYLLIISLVLFSACKKSTGKADNSDSKTILYKTVLTNGKSGDLTTTEYYYNKHGLDSAEVIKAEISNASQVTITYLYEYDASDKLVKVSNIIYGLVNMSFTFTRDAQGRIVKCNVSPAGAAVTHAFAYNSNGQVATDTTYTEEGNLGGYNVYTYDYAGNQAGEQVFTAYDHPMRSDGLFRWTFDNKANPYNTKAFHDALIARDETQMLCPNNAIGQYAGNDVVNHSLTYQYNSNGLPAVSLMSYLDGGVQYIDKLEYFYQ